MYIFIVIIALVIIGVIFLVWWSRKKWNLNVEFKLTRADGRLTNAEWGKGYYDSKKGVVYLRRPNMGRFSKGIAIRIFDVRKYIQGTDIITVIQVGPEDFRPVLNDSWSKHVVEYVDDETGEVQKVKESILNIKVDSGLNKAWKSAWDVSAKKAYSITSFLSQFAVPISIAIVVLACFVGFAILWTKLGSVCGH